jgi:hypothetical protein
MVLCGSLVISIMTERSASGALGGGIDSISTDRKALSAVHIATTSQGAYTVQEMNSGAQTIREYVSRSGVVFAVGWNGRSHPDLDALLGGYAGEYRNALKQGARKRGQRRRQVVSSRVVVETWGHMRNLEGRAYAPALLPAGVALHEIK